MKNRIKKFESCWHFRDKKNSHLSSNHYTFYKRKKVTRTYLINEVKMTLAYFMVLFHVFMIQAIWGVASIESGKTTLNLFSHHQFFGLPVDDKFLSVLINHAVDSIHKMH